MLAVWASLPPVRRVVWTAAIEASAILAARTSTGHRPATGGAPRDPAREFPEAGARFGRAPVVLDALAGSIYSLPWHTGVGDRNGYPLAPTANGITIDPGCCTGDHVMYEALLRRPARKDRPCPRGRHIQVWRCPPVRRQPLLSQALREDRRSRRPSQAEERRREAPEN